MATKTATGIGSGSDVRLVWEVIEQVPLSPGADENGEEFTKVIETARAKIHQGWLVRTSVYVEETMRTTNTCFVPDPNNQWDGSSHLA